MGTQGPYRGPWGKPRGPFGAPGGDPGAPGGTKGPLRGPLEGLRVFSEPRLGPRIEPGFLTYTLLDVENANSLPQKEIQELGPWGGDRGFPRLGPEGTWLSSKTWKEYDNNGPNTVRIRRVRS